MRGTTALSTLALVAISSLAAAQDTLAPGFAASGSQPVPAAFAAYHTLSNGDRVTFDGLSIDLYDADNGFVRHLGDLPSFVFTSFVEADPAETFALVGESSNGDIYKVMLDGSGMTLVATLPFNFDAVFEDGEHALVSAATCGFGCGNDIVRVDTTSGTTAPVALVAGASGPLAMTADGRLLYATVSDTFPPPPGSTDIVSWTAAQLGSGTLLDLGDATLFHGGLDGAASLAVDPVFGNVFLAESIFGATSSVYEFTKQGDLVGPVVQSVEFLANLELREDGGPGHFHAFQPPDGVKLHYSNGDIATVRPARPQGAVYETGPVTTFEVTGALPDSAMLVLYSGQQHLQPDETAYPVFPDFLFVTGVPLSQWRRGPWLVPIDGTGVGAWSFFDPGTLDGTLVFQGLMTDETGQGFIASSTAAVN
jgi:hypothetical protein